MENTFVVGRMTKHILIKTCICIAVPQQVPSKRNSADENVDS